MVKILGEPTGKVTAPSHKLTYQQDELMEDHMGVFEKPPKPVGEINENRMGVMLTKHGNFRHLFLLPWLLGICLTLYWNVYDFYEGWRYSEKFYLEYISAAKKQHGDDYFKYTQDETDLRIFNYFSNGKMPFKTYFHYHYYEVAYPERNRRTDSFLAIFYLITIPTLLISFLRYRRKAPLYFDRERNLVYTWDKGQVWAQYYDDLVYTYNKHALIFVLYGFHPEDEFVYNGILVTPSSNLYMNSVVDYRILLAFITRYMVNGLESVMKKDWKGRQGFYLYEEKKPDDFEAQLDAVVKYLKDNKINEQAEAILRERGHLQTNEAPTGL